MCGLLAAGCAAGGDHRSGAPASAVPAKSSPPAATPSTASPTATPFPHAANGSHFQACADGRCEVLVTHRVRLPVHCCGLSFLEVTRIRPEGVDFQGVAGDGTLLQLSDQTPDQGGASTIDNLSVAVIALDRHRAVIKLSRT